MYYGFQGFLVIWDFQLRKECRPFIISEIITIQPILVNKNKDQFLHIFPDTPLGRTPSFTSVSSSSIGMSENWVAFVCVFIFRYLYINKRMEFNSVISQTIWQDGSLYRSTALLLKKRVIIFLICQKQLLRSWWIQVWSVTTLKLQEFSLLQMTEKIGFTCSQDLV